MYTPGFGIKLITEELIIKQITRQCVSNIKTGGKLEFWVLVSALFWNKYFLNIFPKTNLIIPGPGVIQMYPYFKQSKNDLFKPKRYKIMKYYDIVYVKGSFAEPPTVYILWESAPIKINSLFKILVIYINFITPQFKRVIISIEVVWHWNLWYEFQKTYAGLS